MKKSFTLLSTILLVFVFASLSIYLYELKSINSVNITNQYLYIQGKNHLDFLEEYLEQIPSLDKTNKIEIENEHFLIYSHIKKQVSNYELDLYVKSKTHNISLHKKIFR